MTDVLVAYLRERFTLKIFGSAAVAHGAAALWAAGTSLTPASGFLAFVLALALLFQFRLWDDLEDLERDRVDHPNRVLVCSDSVPFSLVCAALGTTNVLSLAVAGSLAAAVALVGLDLFFWLAYTTLRLWLPDRVWRFQILLIKYPVFVVVLAAALGSPLGWRLLAASCAIYICACAYETLHDRDLPLGAVS
jgi:hypothetical protein